MIKKPDVIIIGHDPDFCRFIGLNVEFLRNSPPLFFMERLSRLWGYKPEYYANFGGNTGSTYLESIPCGLCLEDYRLKRFFATLEQLVHALKELKTEAPTLDVKEIGWYYQGKSSYIFPHSGCGTPIEPIKEGPESGASFILCPTTGRKLNPNTLLPIEEHIDFNNRSVLC